MNRNLPAMGAVRISQSNVRQKAGARICNLVFGLIACFFAQCFGTLDAAQNEPNALSYYTSLGESSNGAFEIFTGGRKLFGVSLVVRKADFSEFLQANLRGPDARTLEGFRYQGSMDLESPQGARLSFDQQASLGNPQSLSVSYGIEFNIEPVIEDMAISLLLDPESFEGGSLTTDYGGTRTIYFPSQPHAGTMFSASASYIKLITRQGETITVALGEPRNLFCADWRSRGWGYFVKILLPPPSRQGKLLAKQRENYSISFQMPGDLTLLRAATETAAKSLQIRSLPYEVKISGTPLNLDGLQERPAGLHGKIRAEGRELLFVDNTTARFFGVEMEGSACCPASNEGGKMAAFLSSCGVNLVWMTGLQKALLGQEDALDERALQQLIDFAYELRTRGVYLAVELPSLDDSQASRDKSVERFIKIAEAVLLKKCASDEKTLAQSNAVAFATLAADAKNSLSENPLQNAGRAQFESAQRIAAESLKAYKAAQTLLSNLAPDILLAGPAQGVRNLSELKAASEAQAVLQGLNWSKDYDSPLLKDPNNFTPLSWIAYANLERKPLIATLSLAGDDPFRGEKFLWSTAAASLQGCAALILRGYLLPADDKGPKGTWLDPCLFAQVPVLAPAFERMDFDFSKESMPVFYSSETLKGGPLMEVEASTAVETVRLLSHLGGNQPEGRFLKPGQRLFRDLNPVVSLDGRLKRFPEQGVLQISAPRIEAAIGNLERKPRWIGTGALFEARHYALLAVLSLTQNAIADSPELLVLAMGPSKADGGAERGITPVDGSVRIRSKTPMEGVGLTVQGEKVPVTTAYSDGYVILQFLKDKPVAHYNLFKK